MRHIRQLWNNRFFWLAAGALVAALGRTGSATAQQPPSPLVEELRRTLRERLPQRALDDPTLTQRYLKRRADALQTRIKAIGDHVSDLRQALALQDWRDNDVDTDLAAVDLNARKELADHLGTLLRRFLKSEDTTTRLATITMIGEMGTSVRGLGRPLEAGTSFAGSLSPALEELATNKGASREIRGAAARALGKVYPNDPEKAADALDQLLRSEDSGLRRAGADGLAGIMGVVRQLMPFFNTATGVTTSPAYLDRAGSSVVRVAGRGLNDRDRGIRQACLEAIRATTNALAVATRSREENRRTVLLALSRALDEQAPAVAADLDQSQPQAIRRLAAEILADMGYSRQQMLQGPRRRLAEPLPPPRGRRTEAAARPIHLVVLGAEAAPKADRATPATPEQLLRSGLEKALRQMADSLKRDPNVQIRLAIVEALEALGSFAEPVAASLVDAMGDPDRFVRWSATRTLGSLRPVEGTVAGFIRGLRDADLDVRLAAAEAIRKYGPRATDSEAVGPAAADVVAALSAAVGRGDVEMRVAVIGALEAVQAHQPVAIRALVAALDHPEMRVRRAAAAALGALGSGTDLVLGALRAALRDNEPDVRQAASDALLDIAQRTSKPTR